MSVQLAALLAALALAGYMAEGILSHALGPNRDLSGNCWGDNPSFICGGGV
jgi:hypothetical protein